MRYGIVGAITILIFALPIILNPSTPSPSTPVVVDPELKALREKNSRYEMMLEVLATPCECDKLSKKELLGIIERGEIIARKALTY